MGALTVVSSSVVGSSGVGTSGVGTRTVYPRSGTNDRVRRHFADRRQAGQRLAQPIVALGLDDPLVIALPRGGVPVAAEVAEALGAPLDVLVVRKLGVPAQPELALGALAEGGAEVIDHRLARSFGVTPALLDVLRAEARAEIARRVGIYRGGAPLRDPTGRTVVLVDDGLATGRTAEAAVADLRATGAAAVVLAVPVAAAETAADLGLVADEVVAVIRPRDLRAVGLWYDDFTQTSDAEVLEALGRTS
jgi:putative phosphoribosyl transferase